VILRSACACSLELVAVFYSILVVCLGAASLWGERASECVKFFGCFFSYNCWSCAQYLSLLAVELEFGFVCHSLFLIA